MMRPHAWACLQVLFTESKAVLCSFSSQVLSGAQHYVGTNRYIQTICGHKNMWAQEQISLLYKQLVPTEKKAARIVCQQKYLSTKNSSFAPGVPRTPPTSLCERPHGEFGLRGNNVHEHAAGKDTQGICVSGLWRCDWPLEGEGDLDGQHCHALKDTATCVTCSLMQMALGMMGLPMFCPVHLLAGMHACPLRSQDTSI